jgi:hypothetical protein
MQDSGQQVICEYEIFDRVMDPIYPLGYHVARNYMWLAIMCDEPHHLVHNAGGVVTPGLQAIKNALKGVLRFQGCVQDLAHYPDITECVIPQHVLQSFPARSGVRQTEITVELRII